jgi:hypothetical protein
MVEDPQELALFIHLVRRMIRNKYIKSRTESPNVVFNDHSVTKIRSAYDNIEGINWNHQLINMNDVGVSEFHNKGASDLEAISF